MRKIQLIIIAFVSLFLLSFGTYMGYGWWVKYHGVSLKPSQAHPPIAVHRFNQSTAEDDGLATALASSMYSLGVETTPRELTHKLDSLNGIKADGEINWKKINLAYPGIGYYYKRFFGASSLEQDLAHGKLPIVKVKDKEGHGRWLLVTGADESEFLVQDPSADTLVPLSAYGKVYAYRTLYRMQ